MSMNEIEARGKIKYRIANEMRKYGENKEEYEDLEIAIQALKEIREYRAIGTVEELKSMKENGAFTGVELSQIAVNQMKLKKYMEIGTVEELQALKEKNTEREPLKIKTDEKILYMCPCCRKIFIEKYDTVQRGFIPKYCEMCGQNIKWSWGK